MAYITKFSGNVDKTIKLGGEGNPTSVEGYFLGSRDTESTYGPGKLHIFQTKSGPVGVWGKTRMDRQLSDDLKGQMVKVTFTGMIAASKKGMRPSFGYQVQHDPDNTVDVSNINPNAQEAQEDDGEEELSAVTDQYLEEEIDLEVEEPVLARPKAPVRAATVDPSRQAKIQALLSKAKSN